MLRCAVCAILALIEKSGADVAVAFRTLDRRDELFIQPDAAFHAASTMKVPVLIELFRQARAGRLSLDDQIAIVNQFHSIVLLTLMEAIAHGQAIDAASSDEMIAILKRQTFNNRIPEGLPPGIPVAHKTGEIPKIQHDAAIVYAGRPFVLVILVRGLEDARQGSALAAAITRVLYRASQAAG